MRVAALCLALLAAVLAARVEPASACSCALGDPRSALARADAAFVGVLVERREPPVLRSSADTVTLVFRVEESVKGRLGERVEVETAASGASCGIEAGVGDRIGLFLERAGGRWRSNLCAQVAPRTLREAARPLPRADGTGPAALLVGGRFGPARMIALDPRGRTLAYGRGAGETLLLAACPGGQRAVEIVSGKRVVLAIRELRRLRVVSEQRLALSLDGTAPAGVWCRDRLARDVVVFATNLNRPEGSARLLRVRGSTRVTFWRGTALAGAVGGDRIYLAAGARGERLLSVGLNGDQRLVARVPRSTGSLAPSPDGSRIAGIAYSAPLGPSSPQSRLVLVERRTGRVRTAPLGSANVSGHLAWLDARRLAFFPNGEVTEARVYDRSLRVLTRIRSWRARDAAVRGSTAYGLGWMGELSRAALPRGPVRHVRMLPSPVVRAIVLFPSGRATESGADALPARRHGHAAAAARLRFRDDLARATNLILHACPICRAFLRRPLPHRRLRPPVLREACRSSRGCPRAS